MVLTFEKGKHKTYHYKPNLSFANSGEFLNLHFILKQSKTFNLARFLSNVPNCRFPFPVGE